MSDRGLVLELDEANRNNLCVRAWRSHEAAFECARARIATPDGPFCVLGEVCGREGVVVKPAAERESAEIGRVILENVSGDRDCPPALAGGNLRVPGTKRWWEQMSPRTLTDPVPIEESGQRDRPDATDHRHTAWLRSAGFDGVLILGGLALALLAGITILIEPSLFYPILVVDLWVLGYHHVIATFTRLCFDKASFEERRWMIVYLIPIVAAVTALVAWQIGIWIIVTIYFYWQWWHYTRQSWGISRAYRRADPTARYEDGWLDKGVFYSLPVYGVLLRSSEDHPHFIGLDLWTFPVPEGLASTAGYVAWALVAVWAVRRLTAAIQGRLAVVHTLYMLTHFAIFGLAYVWTRDITLGWLMINIWHNLQYILFVWMFNNRRFRAGVDPRARFLSWISQSGRMWLYLLTCIAITGAIYWGVLRTIDWLLFAGLSATIVLYQIVNFHHYIVDALIWTARGRGTRNPRARSAPALAG